LDSVQSLKLKIASRSFSRKSTLIRKTKFVRV